MVGTKVSGAADYLELGRDEFFRIEVNSSKVRGSKNRPTCRLLGYSD